jgi:RNA recognition motif-containing protein
LPKRRKYSPEEGVKLYISNLGSNETEKHVMDEFRKYGEVLDISIKRKNGQSNYFGFIIMQNKYQGEQAAREISRNFGWKVTVYDRDDSSRRNRSRSNSKSRSRSRSRRKTSINSMEEPQSDNKSIPQQQVQSIEEIRSVKVREIWIGNLPPNTAEQTLYNAFFIYGEITKIDINPIKNYAFVKYRLLASASKAVEKSKNLMLQNNQLKVNFSDTRRNKDIIGDEPGYELNENSCKLVHITFNNQQIQLNENTLKEQLKKYGNIKAFSIRPNPLSVYVEYMKTEEASALVNDMSIQSDPQGEKKKLLGEINCDVNFYFKKKIPTTNPYPFNQNQFFNKGGGNPMMNNPRMNNPQMSKYFI